MFRHKVAEGFLSCLFYSMNWTGILKKLPRLACLRGWPAFNGHCYSRSRLTHLIVTTWNLLFTVFVLNNGAENSNKYSIRGTLGSNPPFPKEILLNWSNIFQEGIAWLHFGDPNPSKVNHVMRQSLSIYRGYFTKTTKHYASTFIMGTDKERNSLLAFPSEYNLRFFKSSIYMNM